VATNITGVIAAIFGLLSVYFSAKKNIWVYPTGIISTTIYIFFTISDYGEICSSILLYQYEYLWMD
jgi:nicotinamide riboside transporter PnuC